MCLDSYNYDGSYTNLCTLEMLTNCQSDPECMNEACFFDGESCPSECTALKNNGKCDTACNIFSCNYDDCLCSKGCNINMIDNDVCEYDCMNSNCNYDGGDCCPYSKCKDIDTCDSECMTIECKYSNNQCVRTI